MDRATFDAHAMLAVHEPVPCDALALDALTPQEAALTRHLQRLAQGRVEQEFLPAEAVHAAVAAWLGGRSIVERAVDSH